MDQHWVDGPEDQSEPGNGTEEGSGLGILALNDTTAVESELVDHNEIGNACNGIPAPFWTFLDGEGGEETGEDHDDISHNGDENVGSVKTGQEAKIEKQERGGESPVNITGPVDLTVDGVVGVGNMLRVGLSDDDLVEVHTVIDGHGEVGDGSEGRNESCQDVEQAFLLISRSTTGPVAAHTYGTHHWDTECHGIEGDRRDDHDDEDNPIFQLFTVHSQWRFAFQHTREHGCLHRQPFGTPACLPGRSVL